MNWMLYKDSTKMLSKVALFVSAVSAFAAQDSLLQRQESLIGKLTELRNNAYGLSIEGTARSGYHSSSISSDSLAAGAPSNETNAFSEMDLVFFARPTAESRMRVDFRLHQDWQKAHEQGLNPLLVHWWSYDGVALDKHMTFNLGDMRVGYTPLTIYQEVPNVLSEPEIFKAKRMEVMAYRDLDGTNRRLFQGLNADYHSRSISILDDIHAQGTIARLRNLAKKADQIYFDFDRSDRYLMSGRAGVGLFGVNAGLNHVYTFDRIKSSRNFSPKPNDSIPHEENSVTSIELGFDSKGLTADAPYHFKVNAEYASSNWKLQNDITVATAPLSIGLKQDIFLNEDGARDTTMYVLWQNNGDTLLKKELITLEELKGSALLVNFQGDYSMGDIEFFLNSNYLSVNEKYRSELAMTPAFLGNTPILNSDASLNAGELGGAIDMVRSGSLENIYYTVYKSETQNQRNIFGTAKESGEIVPSEVEYFHLSNNYRMAHYYRNGYTYKTFDMQELGDLYLAMDPSVSLALPLGYATPDRSGFDLDLTTSFKSAASAKIIFGQYSAPESEASYSRMGIGLDAQLGKLLELGRVADVSCSFDNTTESKSLKRKSTRIVAGANVGIWRNISLLAGFQSLTKDLNLGNLTATKESLILAGPQVEIAKGSIVSVQYGLMSNSIEYKSLTDGSDQELSINKSLLSADISVKF